VSRGAFSAAVFCLLVRPHGARITLTEQYAYSDEYNVPLRPARKSYGLA